MPPNELPVAPSESQKPLKALIDYGSGQLTIESSFKGSA